MFVIPDSTMISSFASLIPYPSLIRDVKTIVIELIVAKMVEIRTLKFCLSCKISSSQLSRTSRMSSLM
jgi:hypothetical protein